MWDWFLDKIYFRLGNLCYWLNGGIKRMLSKSKLDRLCCHFWAKSWYHEEKHAGRLP